jgi:hypothetical protein
MKISIFIIMLAVSLFACRNEMPENFHEERMSVIKSHTWRLTVWNYNPPIPFYDELISDHLTRFHEPCDMDDEFSFNSDSTYVENDGCSDKVFQKTWSLSSDGLFFSEGTSNKFEFEEFSESRFKIYRFTDIEGIKYKTTKVYEKY